MKFLLRPVSIALGALATAALGGCYYGDVNSVEYADDDCAARYGSDYYDQAPSVYGDSYGYDCYDADDYRGGFVQIGFGGGWYDNYFYPGYGRFLFDRYNHRYPLRGQYLTYWGGRRAWWRHHHRDHDGKGGGQWQGGHRGDGHRDGTRHDGRSGNHGDGDRDGHRGDRHRGDRAGAPGETSATAPASHAVPSRIGRPRDRNPAARDSAQPQQEPGAIRRPVTTRRAVSDQPVRRPRTLRNSPPATRTTPLPQPAVRARPAPAPRAAPATRPAAAAPPPRAPSQTRRDRPRRQPD